MNQTIRKYIELAKKIHQNIEVYGAEIWADFKPVPFIIYTDEFQVAVGDSWPNRYEKIEEKIWLATGFEKDLFANTCTLYHNQIIAIWDIRTWPEDVDTTTATSHIFHEMFHAHQQTLNFKESNILLGLTYPHTQKSLALTLSENQHLLNILENPLPTEVTKQLASIAKLRSERLTQLCEDYLNYDQIEETIEGSAVYAEVRMVAKLTGQSVFEVAKKHVEDLKNLDTTVLHYRRRLYSVGLIITLCYDILDLNLQTEMAISGDTLFSWISKQLDLNTITHENFISEENLAIANRLLADAASQKEVKLATFKNQPLIKLEGQLEMLSFDPMNVVCYKGECLHLHGRLKINGEEIQFTKPFLTVYEDQIFNIKAIYIPENSG